MRKLFKGGNYSREETIRGSTVGYIFVMMMSVEGGHMVKEWDFEAGQNAF